MRTTDARLKVSFWNEGTAIANACRGKRNKSSRNKRSVRGIMADLGKSVAALWLENCGWVVESSQKRVKSTISSQLKIE